MTGVPASNPRATFSAVRTQLIDAFCDVLDSGVYILGRHVAEFERDWAESAGTEFAVGVSSGTDALALALRAVGVGPGDEVLVPAMTAVATWMAVHQVGAIPVGVDIEARSRGMDPRLAREAITPRTRAVVVVHLFGQPAQVTELRGLAADAGIALVEDAAQAHGATVRGRPVGSLGAIAAFSFYPTKNLGTIGDAGAVTTSDPRLADRVRLLREYGWRTRADTELRGINARLDELQAALLQVLLPGLTEANERRRAVAQQYLAGLGEINELDLPETIAETEPVWHQFVVHHPRRDALAAALAAEGIGTGVHYDPPPPMNTSLGETGPDAFPVAARHAATALSLPMSPTLTDDQVACVTDAVRRACAATAY
jgi:dTDP-4-amino-4,6-dideoxygalactose transaminase